GDDVGALRHRFALSRPRPHVIDPPMPLGRIRGGDQKVARVLAVGVDDVARAPADHRRLCRMAKRLVVGTQDEDVPVAGEPRRPPRSVYGSTRSWPAAPETAALKRGYCPIIQLARYPP